MSAAACEQAFKPCREAYCMVLGVPFQAPAQMFAANRKRTYTLQKENRGATGLQQQQATELIKPVYIRQTSAAACIPQQRECQEHHPLHAATHNAPLRGPSLWHGLKTQHGCCLLVVHDLVQADTKHTHADTCAHSACVRVRVCLCVRSHSAGLLMHARQCYGQCVQCTW